MWRVFANPKNVSIKVLVQISNSDVTPSKRCNSKQHEKLSEIWNSWFVTTRFITNEWTNLIIFVLLVFFFHFLFSNRLNFFCIEKLKLPFHQLLVANIYTFWQTRSTIDGTPWKSRVTWSSSAISSLQCKSRAPLSSSTKETPTKPYEVEKHWLEKWQSKKEHVHKEACFIF